MDGDTIAGDIRRLRVGDEASVLGKATRGTHRLHELIVVLEDFSAHVLLHRVESLLDSAVIHHEVDREERVIVLKLQEVLRTTRLYEESLSSKQRKLLLRLSRGE